MSMQARSREEFYELYTEQLGFLLTSVRLYDEGDFKEAKRIALQLRVLLHDTSSSESLLKHLGKKNSMYFLDTASDVQPGNLMTHQGLTIMRISNTDAMYLPRLEDSPMQPKWVLFNNWWGKVILVDNQQRQISRKELILTISNQEGGAHVDAKIKTFYADLTKGNSMGWMYRNETRNEPILGIEYASIRQMAHELLRSLIPDYNKA